MEGGKKEGKEGRNGGMEEERDKERIEGREEERIRRRNRINKWKE